MGAAGSLTGAAELFRFWVFSDCTFLDISKINQNMTDNETVYILTIMSIKVIITFIQGVLGHPVVNSSMLVMVFCDYIVFFEGGYLLRKYELHMGKWWRKCWVVLLGSVLLNWFAICFFSPNM